MEQLKYKVSLRKCYKVFFASCAIACLLIAITIVISSIKTCTNTIDYVVTTLVFLFFISFSLLFMHQIVKSVCVYKGKIVYKTLFFCKVYKPIDIYRFKTVIEETEGSSITEGTMPGCGTYDKVTTFYDKSGKKLFAFGLAYNNVSTLKKNIADNQKSLKCSKH